MTPRPVALVTGAARGIGFAAAKTLYQRGFAVVVTDVDATAVEEAATTIDPTLTNVLGQSLDVTSTESVQSAVAGIESRLGRLDVLVNNAGIIDPTPTVDVLDLNWERLIDVHLGGTFRVSRAAHCLLRMSGAASIINMSSIASALGLPGRASYCSAKAGIEGLTRSLAVEWARDGIRVNAVAPGYVLTDMVRGAVADGLVDATVLTAQISMGRLADPGEIATVVAFLASPDSSYVTGQIIRVDGGMSVDVRTT